MDIFDQTCQLPYLVMKLAWHGLLSIEWIESSGWHCTAFTSEIITVGNYLSDEKYKGVTVC